MPPKRKRFVRKSGSENNKTNNKIGRLKESPEIKEAEPENGGEYICSTCCENFPTEEDLLQHVIKCEKEIRAISPKYTCKECSKKYTFKSSYKKHCLNEHSKLPNSLACDKCNARCPNKDALDEHIRRVHERDIFTCPKCHKKFVRRSHVLRHMAQSGCDGNITRNFSCQICEAKFSRKDNLMVHIRQQHLLQRNHFSCKSCTFSTKNYSKLINHWHKLHAETPDQYQCDHCGKWTGSRAAMTKHLEIHGEKKFACDVCGYCTYTIEVMRRHVLTHVGQSNRPYKCTLCDNSFIQRLQLQRHMDRHVGNSCLKCGHKFTSKSKLITHMREHRGLQKLFCPINQCILANKEFSNEAALQNHLKVHCDEKEFTCEVCRKRFHSEVNLKRHLSTHTLDRPRRCMYCVSARAYARGEQLARHVRRHHPAAFRAHLAHVRQVLGPQTGTMERVTRSEMESILNLLDAESDRILQGYGGSGVLYGGMQDEDETEIVKDEPPVKNDDSPLLSEDELAENLKKLLSQLVDQETLRLFGWPDESVDVILEKVIEQCGARPADREKWTRVQRLRENSKHLFLYVIEDRNISRMLGTHTIDQIVTHILQVGGDDARDS